MSDKDPDLNQVPYQKGNQIIRFLPKPRPWRTVFKEWWNRK